MNRPGIDLFLTWDVAMDMAAMRARTTGLRFSVIRYGPRWLVVRAGAPAIERIPFQRPAGAES